MNQVGSSEQEFRQMVRSLTDVRFTQMDLNYREESGQESGQALAR